MALAHFSVKVETSFATRMRCTPNARVPHYASSILAHCLSYPAELD